MSTICLTDENRGISVKAMLKNNQNRKEVTKTGRTKPKKQMTINQMMERIQGETKGRAETENSNDGPKSKRAGKRDSGMEMKQTCLIQEMKTLKIEEPKTRAWDIVKK